ncbi:MULTISPECIES: hypothetical protein [unclassified Bradyrhizobium]|uniref:hypothetical protein n=1 Tax=unclassified Bradyrhizobium TaxID=2631580 RepID=UPI001FFA60C4|nr:MULTISPECIES: hypothetical protein [unclassified Bradyrhizobium]MCK1536883.1 hypothetical protein [Bradyrhizobium sp. 176]MCK1560186.1 hypothetical protein [Bradyrhizobium sp. 171]
MSTTEAQARAAVRAQLPGSAFAFPIYWQGDDAPTLPDTPAAFAFVVFNNEGSGGWPAAFGGGRGRNLYRNQALVEAFVFAPTGSEPSAAASSDRAEQIAARLRSFRDTDISVFAADVIFIGDGSKIRLPGLTAANNYQCSVAEISLTFDQIG